MFSRRYLSFLKGIVDSDTLPLSVSRETLQAHSSLKVIKKKIVRKVLDTLKRLSDAERDAAKSAPHTHGPSWSDHSSAMLQCPCLMRYMWVVTGPYSKT